MGDKSPKAKNKSQKQSKDAKAKKNEKPASAVDDTVGAVKKRG